MSRSRLAALPCLLAFAAATVAAGTSPPPPEQYFANCEAPTYASDGVVCQNPDLLALDERMQALLASGPAPGAAQSVTEPQGAWLRRRSRCAFAPNHTDCLLAAYRERIAVLAALGNPTAAGKDHPATCPDAPWGGQPVTLRELENGAVLVVGPSDAVLMVAFAAAAHGSWKPYLRAAFDGERIRLVPAVGAAVTCTAPSPPTG